MFTLPIILYTDLVPHDKDVAYLLDKREGDPVVVERLIAKVQDSGSVQDAMTVARELVSGAQSAIDILPPSRYKDALMDLADQVVDRDM